jgi:hypothetical protein
VFKDRLTKWSEIVPLPNKEVTTVVDALIGICSRLGSPSVLISDRGTEFTAHAMTEITRILDIKLIKTSPSNPRSNGLAENHMRTLKDMLAAYVNQTHTDWDKYASLVAHFYNTTVNDATGFTPFFLLYGREDNSPDHCTTTFNRLAGPPGSRRKYSAIANDLVNHLHIIWSHVSPKLATNVTKFNKPTVHPLTFKPYKVGDYFFRKIIPRRHYRNKEEQVKYLLSSKLQYRYSGPYIITKVQSPVNYLASINGKTQPVHALNMKPHPFSRRLATPFAQPNPVPPLPHLNQLGALIQEALAEHPTLPQAPAPPAPIITAPLAQPRILPAFRPPAPPAHPIPQVRPPAPQARPNQTS